MAEEITCTMCGFRFDPAGHAKCSTCPLKSSCVLVCCPNCGFELVDVQRSRLATSANILFKWLNLKPKEDGQ